MKLGSGQEDLVIVIPRQIIGSSLRVLGLDLMNTKALMPLIVAYIVIVQTSLRFSTNMLA